MAPNVVATAISIKLSIQDVILTRCILSNDPINFPTELIDIILDDAEYWASISSSTGGWMHRTICAGTTGNLAEMECLTSKLVPTMPGGGSVIPQVRKVVFRLRSNDQGISNNAQCRGTYKSTHSWFTVGISLNGSSDPALESKRWFLQSNIHGARKQRLHEIVWTTDPNPALDLTSKQGGAESDSVRGEMDEKTGQGTQATGLDFLQHLQEAIRQTAIEASAKFDQGHDDVSATSDHGVAASIYACAQYGGWENHVSSAEVELLCFV